MQVDFWSLPLCFFSLSLSFLGPFLIKKKGFGKVSSKGWRVKSKPKERV
jgi:hypothetical protein